MISEIGNLAFGLLLLAGQTFALLLMILGAIDLHGHIKEKKAKN